VVCLIARALAINNVDEIIVYDDAPRDERSSNVDTAGYTGDTDPAHFMAHVLTFLETPPFMRKTLLPFHKNFQYMGKHASLDMPHHPNTRDAFGYKEGLALSKPGADRKKKGWVSASLLLASANRCRTLVDVGDEQVWIEDDVPPNTRLTLKFDESEKPTPVHPHTPRTEGGYYWGYSVRQADGLSAVFTESPFEEGYDVSIGTSERGQPLRRVFSPSKPLTFKHLLVVFGGPRGIEYAFGNDSELAEIREQGTRPREMFDHWINVLPDQGSRTIRTEEAIMITLPLLAFVRGSQG
jgi:methyltransferase